MPVVADRSGNNAVVTVTEDCRDIIQAVGVSNAEKRIRCLQRCCAALNAAVEAVQNSDAVLNERVAETQRQVDDIKTKRPTGSL